MSLWISIVTLAGIFSTAVILGTDTFFLTVGRPALKLASTTAATEVMGFFHQFGDARMPFWGVLAIASNLLLSVFGKTDSSWFYLVSLATLILFVLAYNRFSKPINKIQTRAANNGEELPNARELQISWDNSLMIRVPLLSASLIAQCLPLLAASRFK